MVDGQTGKTGKTGPKGRRGRGVSKRLMLLIGSLGAAILLTVGAIGVVSLVTADRVSTQADENTRRVKENAALLDDLCQVAQRLRSTLELQAKNTRTYLASPAGKEPSGLNEFIIRISVPQLERRLKVEQVPARCKKRV